MFKSPIAKAVMAGLALLLSTFNAAYGDNVFSMDEKQQFITTLFTVALGIWGVWRVPNYDKDDAK